ncbi:hypothetical protein MNBD_GAMMA08-2634 [hydrothermal vent metagenome]|uniref:Uncharacterized protein n=1 Tax=hydrothermal vent metagenome TaxID=652676 RepID=A0A3B0X818_9ZZZZ
MKRQLSVCFFLLNMMNINYAVSGGDLKMLAVKDYVIPKNCNFNNIELPFFSNECSPRIKGLNTGLIINAPSKVKITKNFTLNIASTYSHKPIIDLHLSKPLRNSIVFIAVNIETHIPFSGTVEDDDMEIDPPDNEPVDPEILKDKIIGGYVNIDLISVLGIPASPSKYIVYATVGPYKSNVIEIELVNN